jgi:hypothetical protein
MREAVPPLPSTPSWRGAQLKHRDNFTFTLLTQFIIPLFEDIQANKASLTYKN